MQKLIKSIIAMNDSKILNEKEETKTGLNQTSGAPKDGVKIITGEVTAITEKEALIAIGDDKGAIPLEKFTKGVEVGDKVEIAVKEINGNMSITELISHNKANTSEPEKKESTIITGEVISLIVNGDVTIKFGTNGTNRASIPYSKFTAHPMVGDTVKVRLEEMNGNTVITEIISHEKPVKESASNAQENPSKEDAPKDITEEEIELSYIDPEFLLECMSVPTHSKLEYRMVAYVMMWAKRNGVQYDFDEFGNIYLTKGELAEGEFYPCVTSHLDTVQYKHDPYIYAGVPLELQISIVKNEGVKEHKVSVNNEGGSEIGIGADDKGGICICLSMFEHVEKLKACFFLDEETGCHGSDHLDKDWFKDVGYCIGYDSPDLFRAAWSCSGVKLFSYEFYEKWMKPVCDDWGLKDCFYSEPITDVMEIRKQVGIICMNFGNGGYNAHMENEYCIIEHMDHACGMGIALIDHIGLTRHELKHTSSYETIKGSYRIDNGMFIRTDVDDTKQLENLGDTKRWPNRTYSSTNTNTTRTTTTKDEQLNFDMVKYIVNRYDGHILAIKDEVLDSIKKICETSNIDFSLFETEISGKFNNEVKF